MPKFELSHDDGVDLATWLHYQVTGHALAAVHEDERT